MHLCKQEVLARTVFFTSFVSFVVFFVLDTLFPGFVSRFFWVHWFLLVAILSALWWNFSLHKKKQE